MNYVYDKLYRLTAADYSTGDYYHYGYDAVGNRLSQEKLVGGLLTTDSYLYDDANRILSVDGVSYAWDNNGNLLSDGVKTYAYDFANRLVSYTGPSASITYAYNGAGDRLQETVDGQTTTFTMDLNAGLTQALSDGTQTYLYGLDRIAQVSTGAEYFLGDALGSVRQMASEGGEVTYRRSYEPYGVTIQTQGSAQSQYGFANEYDEQGLVYLRARYYAAYLNQFIQRDTIGPDPRIPADRNKYTYVRDNPINYTDPSGRCTNTYNYTCRPIAHNGPQSSQSAYVLGTYERFDITLDYMYKEMITNSQSNTVKMIRDLLSCYTIDPSYQHQRVVIATLLWAEKVAPHRPWDHKPILENKLYLAGDPSTSSDDDYYFPIRGNTTHEVYYDIWSNIHFGFVGLAAGFSEQDLQGGASVPFLAGTNDPGDAYTIDMGFELWKKYSTNLTMNNLHQIILDNIDQLTTLGKAFTPWTNGF